MAEISRFWEGIGTGLGPYSADNFCQIIERLCQSDPTTQGPIKGQLNQLATHDNGGVQILVHSGYALVKGTLYINDGDVTLNGGADGTYAVILRKDYVAQTVRAVLKGPTVGGPAMVQIEGDIWEIHLAGVVIAGGDITLLDDDENYCIYNTDSY